MMEMYPLLRVSQKESHPLCFHVIEPESEVHGISGVTFICICVFYKKYPIAHYIFKG